MTPEEKIKLLAEMLEQFAHCEYTRHASHPIGWSCLDMVVEAHLHPLEYTKAYQQRILDGEELCLGCRARELLGELGLGGKS